MRKSSGVLYLVSAVVLAVGISACRPSEADRLMKQLNLELENRQQYIAEFEKSLDSLTAQAAQTGDDSLRWFFYDCLRKEYYYYNVDSSAVYVDKMSHLAKNSGRADWQAIAIVAQADISYSRFDYSSALNLFESVDTSSLSRTDMIRYWSLGMQLHKDILNFQSLSAEDRQRLSEAHNEIKQSFEPFYDESIECRMRICRWEIDHGNFSRAKEIINEVLSQNQVRFNNISAAYYYLYSIYEGLGDKEKAKCSLIQAVILDVQGSILRSLAMQRLSILLFDEMEYDAALKFLEQTIADASRCNYRQLQISAIDAQKTMIHAIRSSEKSRFRLLLITLISVSFLFIVAVSLFIYSMNKRYKLARANRQIRSINARLENANTNLKDSNQIKDNYVSAYMKLSTHYIRQVDVVRKDLKMLAKEGGLDAVMKNLRSPKYADEEYRQLYKFFDSTFLSLFPDFVNQVNLLLPDQHKFKLKKGDSLPTELRVLAAIRLGITKSPEIADVLNCAVRTVYKYRMTLKGIALCPREEFEEKVKNIGK